MVLITKRYTMWDEPLDLHGVSTETKPVNVPNGSVYVEFDTSKLYFFNKDDAEWLEWGVKE